MNNLKLKKTINASGKMSILGVSTISDKVIEAMKIGGQHYYEMDKLHLESGKFVANILHTESAFITNSASSAIALAVAGLITKNDPYQVEHIHSVSFDQEIMIMKGHMIDYGAPVSTMIHLGGGISKEIGYANGCDISQLEAAVTKQTAGILFVKSHHCIQKNMPSLEEVSAFARRRKVPLILDIAAEENISGYAELADLIILSGSKAIEGPTSGILAGETEYVDYAQKHNKGIGRAMKVGKESIFGLLKAMEGYASHKMSKQQQLDVLKKISKLEEIQGVQVTIHQDETGRAIYRARIGIDEEKAKYDALQLTEALQQGDIAIYTRDYNANIGYFDIDPRPLFPGDAEIIVSQIKQILGG